MEAEDAEWEARAWEKESRGELRLPTQYINPKVCQLFAGPAQWTDSRHHSDGPTLEHPEFALPRACNQTSSLPTASARVPIFVELVFDGEHERRYSGSR